MDLVTALEDATKAIKNFTEAIKSSAKKFSVRFIRLEVEDDFKVSKMDTIQKDLPWKEAKELRKTNKNYVIFQQ